MKYCPFCGAEILGNKSIFCAECGESLQKQEKDRKRRKKPRKVEKLPPDVEEVPEEPEEDTYDEDAADDYDGYYDDVLPADTEITRQTLDKELMKRLAILLCIAMLIIGACVALMCIL